MVELPELRVVKKVKSMQVFRQPVSACRQGDRAGICVTQLDASSLERTLLCTPGSVPTFSSAIAAVEKVRFFSGALPSKSKVRGLPQCLALDLSPVREEIFCNSLWQDTCGHCPLPMLPMCLPKSFLTMSSFRQTAQSCVGCLGKDDGFLCRFMCRWGTAL